ncbi:2Fe-2S iron-sulfur cluster-binding protein [Vibrio sp. CDRSL-10 TSBA]
MLELMINSDVVKVASAQADTMLLNYLREEKQMTGSKEGCASGDCGACTVVMVDLDDDQRMRYRQINACITPIHALHGKQIITVEHLKQHDQLHPVQQMVVDRHGSQCGFCTPGIVMSLYALSKQEQPPHNPSDFLAGNLCRCTGYGPLIDAANAIAESSIDDPLSHNDASVRNLAPFGRAKQRSRLRPPAKPYRAGYSYRRHAGRQTDCRRNRPGAGGDSATSSA